MPEQQLDETNSGLKIAANDAGAPAAAAVAVVKELKYHAQIAKFADCPPQGTGVFEHGYRFCFADLGDARNFQPNAILDLSRNNPPAPCCSSFALSMFVDRQALLSKGLKIQKTVKKFFEKKGDHFAKMALAPNRGRCTTANGEGHFDFFEYIGFDAVDFVIEHAKLQP